MLTRLDHDLNILYSSLTFFTDKFQLETTLKAMPCADVIHSHARFIVRRLAIPPVLILAGTRAIRPRKPVAAAGAGPGALTGWICPQAEPATPVCPIWATGCRNKQCTSHSHLKRWNHQPSKAITAADVSLVSVDLRLSE